MYAYVGADPINLADPFGLQEDKATTLSPLESVCRRLRWCYSFARRGDSQFGGSNPNPHNPVDAPFELEGVLVTAARNAEVILTNVRYDATSLLQFGQRGSVSLLCGATGSIGWGADMYPAGVGISFAANLDLDLSRGRVGASMTAGVGVGAGASTGPQFSSGGPNSGVISANVGTAASVSGSPVPGLNVGLALNHNWAGTHPGSQTTFALARAGTPVAYVNGNANVGLATPAIYDLGCSGR